MKHILTFLFLLSFITACSSPAASTAQPPTNIPATTASDVNVSPTQIPNTPEPEKINAPLVDNPALVSLDMLNEKDGWAVSEKQILRTNDGCVTWYDLTPPNVTETGNSVQTFFLDVNHAWVQIPDFNNYPNAGTLYHTIDGGITWASSSTPFSAGNIKFLDDKKGWVLADLGAGAGSQGVAVFQTTDGGATWNQTYTNDPNQPGSGDSLPLGGIKSGLEALNMQTAWVTGVTYSDGTVYLYRTDDGGRTWSQQSLPLPLGAEKTQIGINHLELVSPTDGFLLLNIPSDVYQVAIYVTHDAGNTWTLTPTLIPQGGSVNFLSATEMIIYNGEQFYVTRDAAHTWSIIPPDVVFGDNFANMDFVSASIGWVITSDANSHRSLYHTDDGGATWSTVIP